MLNDTTIVRFHFSPGQAEQLRPDILGRITNALENLATAVIRQFEPVDVQLYLVASPQRGSIEFHFKVDIKFRHSVDEIAGKIAGHDKSVLGTLSDFATIATLLWCVVFGGEGIVDLMRERPPTEPKSSTDDAKNLQKRIALEHRDALDGSSFDTLIDAGLQSGAVRIEVQLPDEPPVVVFDRPSRQASSVIGRRGDRSATDSQRREVQTVQFDFFRRESVLVEYKGHRLRAFKVKAERQSGMYSFPVPGILLVPENFKLPDNESQMRVCKVDLSDIVPLEPLDSNFDSVSQGWLYIRKPREGERHEPYDGPVTC